MKKIFNLILAALVIIVAAACTKNEEVVSEPQGESLSFYAEVVNGDTRAYIDDADGDKVWNTIWEEGDAVYVGADNADPYIFNYANGKFTCSEQGVTSLIGQSVIVAPYLNNNDSTAGKSAWSFTGTRVENFDADVKVQLTADTSFFRYTYNGTGEVTITVAPANNITKVFRYCEEEDVFDYFSSITLKGAATDKFVGFWPQTLSGLEATLSYSINGVKCKETSITLATGKVYNLGTLADPAPELATVYLVPGVWVSDGARFAVYEIDTQAWTSMTAVEGQTDTYSAKVATSNIIFVRLDPSKAENSWDNKWNQTADLVVPTDDKNCYYITDWGTDASVGEWHELGYKFPVITEQYKVYVYQSENTWSNVNLYSWNSSTSANYTGSWPGTANTTTETINGYTYRVWELPTEATGKSIMVILNNGSSQTGDSGPYTINGDLYLLLRGTGISVIEDPNNPEPTVELQPRSIYALATHTSTLNIYWWNAGPTWPGTAMTTEYINGVKYYKYTFDKSLDGSVLAGVIFNNGSSQTGDIKNVKLDKDLFYKVNSNWSYSLIADPR